MTHIFVVVLKHVPVVSCCGHYLWLTPRLTQLVLCKAHNAVREVKEDLCTVHPQSEAAWKHATLRVPARESITITQQMCRIISVAHYIKVTRHARAGGGGRCRVVPAAGSIVVKGRVRSGEEC